MNTHDRKAAIAAYKERKTVAGIYAIRCTATRQTWVGQTPNLDTVQTRIWFTLRLGNSPHRLLQSAWTAHGADSFTFEALERMDDEEPSPTLHSRLKRRAQYWRATLDAFAI
jgi:hypothetical protein